MNRSFLIFCLTFIVACASTTKHDSVREKDVLQVIDGSTVFIEYGKVVHIVDSQGKTVPVKKGAMMELADGNFIYVRQDRSVKKINTENESKKNEVMGHNHTH